MYLINNVDTICCFIDLKVLSFDNFYMISCSLNLQVTFQEKQDFKKSVSSIINELKPN